MSDITSTTTGNTSADPGSQVGPDAGQSAMTIGELSDVTGLSASAIRFYQRRGVLPARDAGTSWQRFGRDTLDRLAVIELAKSAGFSLDETTRILDAFATDPDTAPAKAEIWHGLAEHKIEEIQTQISRLQTMCQLLKDALSYSYISPDRARQVCAALGWVDGDDDPAHLATHVRVPSSTRDLHALTEVRESTSAAPSAGSNQ